MKIVQCSCSGRETIKEGGRGTMVEIATMEMKVIMMIARTTMVEEKI